MPSDIKNIKAFPTRWRNILLRKTVPYVYPRYYRRRPGFSQVVPYNHFYLNEKQYWCEVFYEQIDNELWLLALEVRAKYNNHYILQPKKSKKSYYSINFFSAPEKLGYLENNDIRWIYDQVNFLGPGTTCELYQEKDSVFNCCRMIFTSKYLAHLINVEEDHLTKFDLQNMMTSAMSHFYRITTKAEIFLQLRLFNVLKHERGKYHYRASVFSKVFELTAFFLNYLCTKRTLG